VIVLYDGECRFCRWTIAWALERDAHRALAVAPIQSPAGARLLADLPAAERLRSLHVVHDDARRASGGAAVRDVLDALPSARALAWVASRSPRFTDFIYGVVARHRGQIGRLVPRRRDER
jgi:predicted DCC family thiol-disulfide oxidoreductase YuxK